MKLRILILLLVSVFTNVWATKTEEKTSGKFMQSERSAFQKFNPLPKQSAQVTKIGNEQVNQSESVDRMEISAGTSSQSLQEGPSGDGGAQSKRSKSGEQPKLMEPKKEEDERSSEATQSNERKSESNEKEMQQMQTPSKKRCLGKKKMQDAADATEKVGALVARVIFKSTKLIKDILKKSGFKSAFNSPSEAIFSDANKVVKIIELVKEYTTANFVLDEMKSRFGGGESNIEQIINEIMEEIIAFENYMRNNLPPSEDTNSKNEQMIREKSFFLTFCRLYQKLFKIMAMDTKVQKIVLPLKWTEQMMNKLRQKLEGIEKQETLKWSTNLFRLEDIIESAKLALLISFPPNSLNEWIKSGGKWNMLMKMVNQLKINELLNYYDDNTSIQRSLVEQCEKCNVIFNNFEFNYLLDLYAKIDATQNVNILSQNKAFKLVKTSAIFRKIIADLRDSDDFLTNDLKNEKESAENFLKRCIFLLDEKFNNFKKKAIKRIEQLDRIRKTIFDGGESSKSK